MSGGPLWYRWRGDPSDLEGIPGVDRGFIPTNALGALSWRDDEAPIAVPLRTPIDATWDRAMARVAPWVADFLTSYQIAGVKAVLTMPGGSGFLFHPAGSGKTLSAIVWGLAAPAPIITVTKGAVKPQWGAEIERFVPGLRPTVLNGEDAGEIDPAAAWLVLNYEILPAWIDALEKWAAKLRVKPSVVFDESHKSKSAKRWDATAQDDGRVRFKLKENVAAAAMRLSKLAGRRLGTTATPVRDRPRDLWAQLDLIHPRAWGRYGDYATRYCAASINAYGGRDDRGKSNETELAKRLAYVVHRVRHSEANRLLPPKRRSVVYIPIDQQVKADGVAKMLKEAGERGATSLLEARLMEAAARKRRWIVQRVTLSVRESEKVIVFTGRKKDATGIRDGLITALEGVTILHGDGSDSPAAREEIRKAYMAHPGPCVLVGTTDAWGEGLNLHSCDLLLIGLLPYTPGQIIQLEGRVHRLGQDRPVLVEYTIAEGTADEHVAGILINKLPVVEKMIESDEVRGLARELAGLDDPKLVAGLAAKLMGGA
jgi:SWI/SNF-related matrix-associated actin-dependent regulator 1 of chromatin subfamily A